MEEIQKCLGPSLLLQGITCVFVGIVCLDLFLHAVSRYLALMRNTFMLRFMGCLTFFLLSQPLYFVHLVRHCAANPARSAGVLSCCMQGLHAQPVLFALVCLQCFQRPLAGVSGTSEQEGGWLFLPWHYTNPGKVGYH